VHEVTLELQEQRSALRAWRRGPSPSSA